jgi:hypothetical protein
MVGYRSVQLPPLHIGSLINKTLLQFLRSWLRLDQPGMNAVAAVERLPSASLPAAVALPNVPVAAEVVDYTFTEADMDLAVNLGADIKTHPDSMELREYQGSQSMSLARSFYSLAKLARDDARAGHHRRVRLHLYHGAPGTGKTYTMLRDLDAVHRRGPGFDASNLRFHCWNNNLRGPLERDALQFFPFLASGNFQTGCMPLVQPYGGTLVLDDATQLWAGYLPLLVACSPQVTDIYISFDACQGRGCFPKADSISRGDVSTAEWLSALSTRYATESNRLSLDNSQLFGLNPPPARAGRVAMPGNVYLVSNVSTEVPLLVVSPRFEETKNKGGQRCLTFQSCQGFTIDGDVTIDLGGLSATSTDQAWWTALTRARGNIMLFLGPLSQGRSLNESLYGQSNIASAILAACARASTGRLTPAEDPLQLVARAVQAHMSRCLSPAACAALGLVPAAPIVGSSRPPRADWLAAPDDPLLRDFYTARTAAARSRGLNYGRPAFSRHSHNPTREPEFDVQHALRHLAPLPADTVMHSATTGYRLPPPPVIHVQPDPALNTDLVVDPEAREIVLPNTEQSHQHVPDGPHTVLRHHGWDRVTALHTEAARIQKGVPDMTPTPEVLRKLAALKRGFKVFVDVDAWNKQKWDPALFGRLMPTAYTSWIAKRTGRAITTALAKNPWDSPQNHAHLFLKSQVVKKKEKRGAPATKGQTVSEFNLVRQFEDMPEWHYLEHMLKRYVRPTTYLHHGASPAAMDAVYQRIWQPGQPMTWCDYTSLDAGYEAAHILFMDWLMEMSGLDRRRRARFVRNMTTVYSHRGPHQLCMPSGTRGTWTENTVTSMAMIGASLLIPEGTPAFFSGDDSIILGLWRDRPGFNPDEWRMRPKRQTGLRGEFCSFSFGGLHLAPDHDAILFRTQDALALGRNDVNYWRSISDAIRECRDTELSYSLATARANLKAAAQMFGFDTPLPLVFA